MKTTKTVKKVVKKPRQPKEVFSQEYLDFQAYIERYKVQKPAKYEATKEALLAQLNALR